MKVLSDYEILKSYIPIAEFIAEICGPRYEVTIHNLADIEHSIMYIAHGGITGRKVNDGLIDFALNSLSEYKNKNFGVFIPGKKTADNKELRFASYYIKNKKNELIGMLCVTEDITDLLLIQKFIKTDLELGGNYPPNKDVLANMEMAISAKNMVEVAYSEAKATIGCKDKTVLTKKQRMEIVGILNKKSLFEIKGVVPLIADKMNISVPTIYRYLSALNNNKSELP